MNKCYVILVACTFNYSSELVVVLFSLDCEGRDGPLSVRLAFAVVTYMNTRWGIGNSRSVTKCTESALSSVGYNC